VTVRLRVMVCVGWVLASMVVLWGCDDAPAGPPAVSVSLNPDAVDGGTTSLAGVVLDFETGEPLGGVRVETEPGTEAMLTTAEGEFVLVEGVVGERFYRVKARGAGYGDGVAVVYAEARKVEGIALYLVPEGEAGALEVLEDVVVMPAPTQRVGVRLANRSVGAVGFRVEVPAEAGWLVVEPRMGELAGEGRADLRVKVVPDVVRGLVEASGGVRQSLGTTVRVVGASGEAQPLPVVVRLAARSEVSLTREAVELDGVGQSAVVNYRAMVNGAALRHAVVETRLRFEGAPGLTVVRRGETDEQGRLSMALGLEAASAFVFEAEIVSYGVAAEPLSVDTGVEGRPTVTVTVTPGSPVGLGETVEVEARVSGADGVAVAGASLEVVVTAPDGTESTQVLRVVDGVGRVAVGATQPGRWEVRVVPAGADGEDVVTTVSFEVVGDLTVPWEGTSTLELSRREAEIGIAGAVVGTVTVRNAVGEPLAGVAVAFWDGPLRSEGVTDGSGEALFPFGSAVAGLIPVRAEVGDDGMGGALFTLTDAVRFLCPPVGPCPASCEALPLAEGFCVSEVLVAVPEVELVKGVVPIVYTVAHAEGTPVDVEVCFAAPAEFEGCRRATQARRDEVRFSGGTGVLQRGTDANGTTHTFLWDSQADLPNLPTGDVVVMVRAWQQGVPSAWNEAGPVAVRNGLLYGRPPVAAFQGAVGTRVAVADFNGDGKDDLAVVWVEATGGGRVKVDLSNGDGTFRGLAIQSTMTAFTEIEEITVGDLDDDGRPDLVVVGTDGSGPVVELFFDDATSGLAWHAVRPAPTGARVTALHVEDVDGDGYADVVFGASGGGRWCVGAAERRERGGAGVPSDGDRAAGRGQRGWGGRDGGGGHGEGLAADRDARSGHGFAVGAGACDGGDGGGGAGERRRRGGACGGAHPGSGRGGGGGGGDGGRAGGAGLRVRG